MFAYASPLRFVALVAFYPVIILVVKSVSSRIRIGYDRVCAGFVSRESTALEFTRRGIYAFALASLILIFALGQSARAQSELGSIDGSVSDHQGALVPSAEVHLRSLSTSAARSAKTDAQGRFDFSALPVGQYELTVSMTGFKTTATSAAVVSGTRSTVDVKLDVGSMTEQVTVTDESSAVELRDSNVVSHTITEKQLQDLPLGRDLLYFASIQPGVQQGSDAENGSGGGGSNTFFGTLGSNIILSGQSVGHTEYLEDGVPNVARITQSANIMLDPEAMSEFTIQTNGMSAEFAQPGVVQMVSQQGSDRFHGQFYDYFQNNALNALNYFQTKAVPLHSNNFGATLGGFILPKRLYFFANYSGLRQTTGVTTPSIVPSVAERGGDFRNSGVTIYDPATYNAVTGTVQPFLNNEILSDRISDFATKYLAYFPLPNGPGNTYTTTLANQNTFDKYLGRIDYVFSDRDRIYGEALRQTSDTINPTIVPGLFGIEVPINGTNILAEWTHVFSPRLLNTAKVGYNRSVLYRNQQGAGSKDFISYFGLKNLAPVSGLSVPPYVAISGCCALGDPYSPQGATQNLFEYADTLQASLGKHQLSFGAEIDQTQFHGLWTIVNDGLYAFTGVMTANQAPGAAYALGDPVADFLLGDPQVAEGGTGNTSGHFHEIDMSLFAQDNWHIWKKLTVNLGLRYDFMQAPYDQEGNTSIIDLPTGNNLPGTWHNNYLNFGPRVGLSYQATAKTVIGGGYGIYYTSTPYNLIQNLVAKAPNFYLQAPVFTIQTVTPVTDAFVQNPSTTALQPFTLGRSMPTSYVEQWNLLLQQKLASNYLLTLAYVGNGGHHLSIRLFPNQATPDPGYPAAPTPVASRRPYPNLGDVYAQYNIGNSNYHGFQAKLERSFTNGLTFNANYTWSKAMDLATSDGQALADPYNVHLQDYAPSDYDQTNVLKLSGLYGLPFGAGHRVATGHSVLDRDVIGGWQLGGFWQVASGQLVSVTAVNLANNGASDLFYADETCNPRVLPAGHSKLEWFNPSCYAQPGPGRLGTSRRNSVRGPRLNNTNLSLSHAFALKGNMALNFRADLFNAFNHPQFTLAQIAVSDLLLGILDNSRASRTTMLTLKLSF